MLGVPWRCCRSPARSASSSSASTRPATCSTCRLTSLLAIVVFIAFIAGIAYAAVAIPSQTQLQEDLPEDVRGRVFGVLNMLVSVSSFLPIIIVGPISDLIGTATVMLVVAIGDHRRGRQRPPAPATGVAGARPTPCRGSDRGAALGADPPSWRAERPAAVGPSPPPAWAPPVPPTCRPRLTDASGRGRLHRRDDQHGLRPVAGGNVPSLDGAAILARTPGLEEIADVVPIDRGLTPASHFTFADLMWLGRISRDALDRRRSTASWWSRAPIRSRRRRSRDLVLSSPKPVVVTGAMRASHEEATTGRPTCVGRSAAASPALPGVGGRRPRGHARGGGRCHEDAYDGLRHLPFAELRLAGNGGETACRDRTPRGSRRRLRPVPSDGGRVELVEAAISTDGAMLDAAVDVGARGIVVAATGAGNTSAGMLAASERAIGGGRRGRARLAMPGRRGLDRLRVPRWWRDVGASRRDPRRDAVRHQGAGRRPGPGRGLRREELAKLLADPLG